MRTIKFPIKPYYKNVSFSSFYESKCMVHISSPTLKMISHIKLFDDYSSSKNITNVFQLSDPKLSLFYSMYNQINNSTNRVGIRSHRGRVKSGRAEQNRAGLQ